MRKGFGQFRATTAAFGKLELTGVQGGVWFDKGIFLAHHHLLRNGLAVVLGQGRLIVEQIQLAGRATHEQVNDAFGLRLKGRSFGRKRVGRSGGNCSLCRLGTKQRSQSKRSQSDAALAEKPAACNEPGVLGSEFLLQVHSFVIVSSRFSSVRLTMAQAATLCRFTSGGMFVRSTLETLTASAVSFSKCSY